MLYSYLDLYLLLILSFGLVLGVMSTPVDTPSKRVVHFINEIFVTTDPYNMNRTPIRGRVTYSVIALLSIVILAGMFASRIASMRLNNVRSVTFLRVLILNIYAFGMCFVFSATVLLSATETSTTISCHAAIILCLVFYVGGKILMYFFLVERAHHIRGIHRARDWLYLLGVSVLIFGFGPIAGIAFAHPITEISRIDNKCRIGLPLGVTIALLTYDITINIGISGVFIFLMRKHLKRSPTTRGIIYRALPIPFLKSRTRLTSQTQLLQLFVVKSFIGTVAIIIPTVANLVILLRLHGKEQSWLCFSLCTLDICWSIFIIHWLTNNPIGRGDEPMPHSEPTGDVEEYIEMETIR